MKKAIVSLMLISLLNQPAEASVGHIIRKAAWLPVFWVFALPISMVTWYLVADEGKQLTVTDKEEE